MQAYHNDPVLKEFYVNLARSHRKANQIIKQTFWDGEKGCMIGCLSHDINPHVTLQEKIGYPIQLNLLASEIFEWVPLEFGVFLPERYAAAAKPGADLSHVVTKFCIWVLEDDLPLHYPEDMRGNIRKITGRYANVHRNILDGYMVEKWDFVDAWGPTEGEEGMSWLKHLAVSSESRASNFICRIGTRCHLDGIVPEDLLTRYADKMIQLIEEEGAR